jgi:hypothetical protein
MGLTQISRVDLNGANQGQLRWTVHDLRYMDWDELPDWANALFERDGRLLESQFQPMYQSRGWS